MFHGLARGHLGGHLSGIRRAFARTFEVLAAGAAPGDRVAVGISQSYNRIIKRRLNMRLAARNRFPFTPPGLACCFLLVCHICNTSLALLLRRLLLAGYRALRTAARARVGARALAAHWQVAAMTQTAIAADLDQPLDVHVHLAAQIALDFMLAVDQLTKTVDLFLGQIFYPDIRANARSLQDLTACCQADPIDIAQRNLHALFAWDV